MQLVEQEATAKTEEAYRLKAVHEQRLVQVKAQLAELRGQLAQVVGGFARKEAS